MPSLIIDFEINCEQYLTGFFFAKLKLYVILVLKRILSFLGLGSALKREAKGF